MKVEEKIYRRVAEVNIFESNVDDNTITNDSISAHWLEAKMVRISKFRNRIANLRHLKR